MSTNFLYNFLLIKHKALFHTQFRISALDLPRE